MIVYPCMNQEQLRRSSSSCTTLKITKRHIYIKYSERTIRLPTLKNFNFLYYDCLFKCVHIEQTVEIHFFYKTSISFKKKFDNENLFWLFVQCVKIIEQTFKITFFFIKLYSIKQLTSYRKSITDAPSFVLLTVLYCTICYDLLFC